MIPNRSPECSVRAVTLVKADLALVMCRVNGQWQEAPEAKSGQPKASDVGSCGVSDVPLAALPRSPVANSSLLGVQGKVLSRAGGLLCSSRSLPEDKVVSLLHSSSGPCWMRAGVVRAAPF